MSESARLWEIRRMDSSDDRTSFDCGTAQLNQWLYRLAGQYERRNLARTYVARRPGQAEVVGYYSLSNHQVCYEALTDQQGKELPNIDIPAVLLARIAVDKRMQGQGLGAFLLIDALRRAAQISQHIGMRVAEVDAIDDDARRFYEKYGFAALRDNPRHLFLPIHVIRKLNLSPF